MNKIIEAAVVTEVVFAIEAMSANNQKAPLRLSVSAVNNSVTTSDNLLLYYA